ncbi:protein MpABC1 [Marchantia polymorpha subsp. ruderalis]|uniref:ABC transporter domain-containing protein n=2 Tax=Marchantia polymorpha TaxID=3197 RepID=A0AAF6AKS3_MARPO|nr:hypothetical protein MARPO_0113s0007 [Marchantia polymorpha]BBM97043.1 hypothetical protein Mp_1g02590 [Marchantia polymorpha subsp. ruderalis]|eukprot:PTQ31265.1 hypothetical protein MARPO_0113s0007 [Marchantia polymorpha]
MALVGKGNFLSLEPGQSVRCIASCAKPVSRPFRALAAGKCSNVGNLCSRSIHTRRVARVDEFEIFGISRVRQVRQRLRMQNRFMAQSDMVTPERGENEDATGAHATEKPMPERVAEIKGEPSSAFAVAIRNLGLNVKNEKGEIPVLKDCSLNVPEGQLWMLLGPNGCGKSTLLKAMAGLLKPNRGKMFVIGPRSFVFQNPDHQVVMPTAEADVAFGLGRFELSIEEVRERVHNSLKAVGMDSYAQRPVQTLSGGQKQRIAIAGALAESSRLLLLDELTTYLDRGDQIGVLEAVRQVVGVEQKVTALWVTHRLEELEYADGAAYMENGRVVLSGSVAEIEAYIKRKQAQFYSEQEMLR